jgi:hypothetical protein
VIVADGILDSIPPGPALVAVAAFLAAIAVYLFLRQKGAPILWIGLLIVALTVLTGYLSAGSPKPPPRVKLQVLSPTEGEVLPSGRPIPVLLDLQGAELVPTSVQTFSSPPPANAGHIHILVDGRLKTMPPSGRAQVTLTPGSHSISAEFVDPYHRSFSPRILDTVHVIAGDGSAGSG